MSLTSALTSSVSALRAQSAAIAAVSENIANSSTTAYKTREISFESLVTSSGTSSLNQVGGSVTYTTSQNMTEQGSIESTGVATNVAIEGNGFFVVTDDVNNQTSGYVYTRNGSFSTNEDGQLVNSEGYILLGYPTDEEGEVTATNSTDLSSLEAIDLGTISGTAQATSEVDFNMNLPADAEVTDDFTTSMEVYDELGVSHTVEQTWTKTAANTWELDFSDPYQTSDETETSTGTITVAMDDGSGTTITMEMPLEVTFNGDGSLATIGYTDSGTGTAYTYDAAELEITLAGLSSSTGSDDVTFNLDMGEADSFDGLTQFSSDEDAADVSGLEIEQDGVRYGELSGVEIDDSGLVTATFDNGVVIAIYQIAIATFSNPSGLTNVSGTIYDENENAGNLSLTKPGEGNAGDIVATSLEVSSTDTSEEFNKMIVAQQAYSGAAQILSAVDEMFDTLISAVR